MERVYYFEGLDDGLIADGQESGPNAGGMGWTGGRPLVLQAKQALSSSIGITKKSSISRLVVDHGG